jgi:spermidine synthase
LHYTDVARATSQRGEIVLRERFDAEDGPDAPRVLELRVNGVFVMDTLETSSERGLAAAALAQVVRPRRVLVGGLGLGLTLHEVLADPRVESVDVVEIEDALVRWMRDGTVPHGPAYLADARANVVIADVREVVARAAPDAYDLVLLDVDNGPGFLVYSENESLYQRRFIEQVRRCLHEGGALVIWSSAESPMLQAELRAVFGNAVAIPFDVVVHRRGDQYWIYLSRR